MRSGKLIFYILIIVFIILLKIDIETKTEGQFFNDNVEYVSTNYEEKLSNNSEYVSINNGYNYYSNIVDFPSDFSSESTDFYYSTLNTTQKRIYDSIKKNSLKFEGKVKLNKDDLTDVYIAQNAVAMDNPEFFWINSVLVTTVNEKVVQVEYKIPASAKNDLQRIKQISQEIIANSGTNKVEQIKYFYDWIVQNTDYYDTQNSQSITSVFLDKQSVCAGYSKAFQYLCKEAGIECLYVNGYTKDNMLHAWNMVKLNDNYYWVDVTWGDPIFAEGEESTINYNYLLVSDKDFLNDHIVDNTIKMEDSMPIKLYFTFPECTDDSLNYYRLKGCYFDSYNKIAVNDYLKSVFAKGIYQGIELKFANDVDFERFLDDYFGKTKYIFDVVKSANRGYYGTINVSTNYIDTANYIRINIEL